MSKRGLPTGIKMRHDSHYVEEFSKANQAIGKVLPIEKVFPNPEQPRTEFGNLEELSASIKEQGVLEPLLVQPKDGQWMIIAGERRWRASKLAGLEEIPCIVLDVDDETVAEIALVENLQRKDLNIWEVADGLADLAARFDYTHEQISQKIGKSRSSVTESLAIAGLPKAVRKRCQTSKIEAKSTLVEISREFDEAAMNSLLDKVSSKPGTIIREDVRSEKMPATSITQSSALKKSKTNTTKGSAVAKTSVEKPENVFSYKSEEQEFELKIKHLSDEAPTRTDLLIALKEVFDSVKAGD